MQWRTGRDPLSDEAWAKLDEHPLPDSLLMNGIATRLGVVYSSPPGYRPLELDLYMPDEPSVGVLARRPAIVWIHGGAFAMGSKRLLPGFLSEKDFFVRLARAGFVVASIDYRLSAEALWPAQVIDVRAAIRWMRSRAEELALDPSSIAVWGESAGGISRQSLEFSDHKSSRGMRGTNCQKLPPLSTGTARRISLPWTVRPPRTPQCCTTTPSPPNRDYWAHRSKTSPILCVQPTLRPTCGETALPCSLDTDASIVLCPSDRVRPSLRRWNGRGQP